MRETFEKDYLPFQKEFHETLGEMAKISRRKYLKAKDLRQVEADYKEALEDGDLDDYNDYSPQRKIELRDPPRYPRGIDPQDYDMEDPLNWFEG